MQAGRTFSRGGYSLRSDILVCSTFFTFPLHFGIEDLLDFIVMRGMENEITQNSGKNIFERMRKRQAGSVMCQRKCRRQWFLPI
jgi:hypothetical protein